MTQTLNEAIDALVQRQRVKLARQDARGHQEWHTLPSLWEQLESAVGYATGQGGAGAYSSRPTIATGIVSLIIEVSQAASEGAMEHAGQGRGNAPANLRAIAAKLAGQDGSDQWTWWRNAVLRWVQDAKAQLNINPTLPRWARGTRCPDCGADQATSTVEGEPTRTPALAILWDGPTDDVHRTDDRDWLVRAVECMACGATWFRGVAMNELVDQMLAANATRETMTEGIESRG